MRCAGEHRSELDEEKPPFRAVQGGAGKHSGESEAYTNLSVNYVYEITASSQPVSLPIGITLPYRYKVKHIV